MTPTKTQEIILDHRLSEAKTMKPLAPTAFRHDLQHISATTLPVFPSHP
jgi:hypothetical protein